MPLCNNLYTIVANVDVGESESDPSWPYAALRVIKSSQRSLEKSPRQLLFYIVSTVIPNQT